MNKDLLCPICGEGHLHPSSAVRELTSDGVKFPIACAFHLCDVCASDIVTASDFRANSRALKRASQASRGRFVGVEIRAIREKLKLSQEEAAMICGGGPVAFSKYENDATSPAESMESLLWLLDRFPHLVIDLAERAGLGTERWITPSATIESSVTKMGPREAETARAMIRSYVQTVTPRAFTMDGLKGVGANDHVHLSGKLG